MDETGNGINQITQMTKSKQRRGAVAKDIIKHEVPIFLLESDMEFFIILPHPKMRIY